LAALFYRPNATHNTAALLISQVPDELLQHKQHAGSR